MSNLVRFSLPLSFPGRISDPQTEQGMAEGETIETQTAGNQFLPLINQVLQNTIVSPQSQIRKHFQWPIRGQYSGHVTCLDQSEAGVRKHFR